MLILIYHRITPAVEPDPFGLKVTPENFVRHLAYIARSFQITSMMDLVMQFKQGHLRHRRQIAITFDDGYGDNYAFAVPALRKHDLPAIIYLTANYIDKQRYFWWDELEQIIMGYQEGTLEADPPIGHIYHLSDPGSCQKILVDLCMQLRKSSTEEREKVLA